MRKGFTLIELLAVIVILAVIALIATPIVVDIINDTDESATLRSADFYLKGVELSIAQMKAVKNLNVADGKYSIMEDGNICIGVLENNTCDGEILKVEVKGEKPNSGYIEIANGGIENIDFTISDNRMVKNSNGETIHFPCVLEDGYKNI